MPNGNIIKINGKDVKDVEARQDISDLKSQFGDIFVAVSGDNYVDARTIRTGYVGTDGVINSNTDYRSAIVHNLPAGTYTFAAYNNLGNTTTRAKRVYVVNTGEYYNGNSVASIEFTLASASDVIVSYSKGLIPVVVSGTTIAYSNLKNENLIEKVDIRKNAVGVLNYVDNTAQRTTGSIQADGTISTAGASANYETLDFAYLPAGTYNIKNFAQYTTCNILLFDVDKNVSFDTRTSISQTGTTITTVHDGYIRVSTYAGGNVVVTTDTLPSEYSEKYDDQFVLDGVYMPPDMYTIHSANLADPAKCTNGTVDSSGNETENADYTRSDYIPVEYGKSYFVAVYTYAYDTTPRNTTTGFILYDANKSPITNTRKSQSASGLICTVSDASAAYIRGWGRTAGSYVFMVAEGSSTYRKYEPYYVQDEPVSVGAGGANVLWGKNYYAAGGSWTQWSDATYTDGPYAGTYITYDKEIRLRNNMSGVNDGVGGSTMALTKEYIDGTAPITERSPYSYLRYLQIPADADYCTLAFGINDESHTYLGTIDDATNETFYGALNVVFDWIVTNRPGMKTLVIIWDKIGTGSVSGYRDALIASCKKYGIPYFDPYNDAQVVPFMYGKAPSIGLSDAIKTARYDYFHAVNNIDHPGQVMHKYVSTIIEDILRSL